MASVLNVFFFQMNLIFKYRDFSFKIFLIFFISILSGCTTPKNSGEAASNLLRQGITGGIDLKTGIVQLPILGQSSQIISANQPCEGSAGSVLPPLSFQECTMGVLISPLVAMESIFPSEAIEPNNKHILLSGVERYWEHQQKPNDCWAAAFKMTRDILGFKPLTQNNILEIGKTVCPKIENQDNGADAYQILTIIFKTFHFFDQSNSKPKLCRDPACIVSSLTENRPVMMLKSGHAVLIVGMDYINGTQPVTKRLYVLDPASDKGEIKKLSNLEICTADMFISY